MSDIVQLYSDKSKTKKAYPKTLASETYMSSGGTVESQLAQIENKNIEQDSRLKEVERVNKVQDVYVRGLFNENKDGRLSVEGEGNDLKLEGSKAGLVEIDRVVGNTLVNIKQGVKQGSSVSYENGVFTTNASSKRICVYSKLVKASTMYTIISLNNLISTGTMYEGTLTGFVSNSLVDKGNGVYIVTTSSSCKAISINFKYSDDSDVDINDAQIIILEGDYTNKPIPSEYIEGLQSSFESNLVTQEMINEGLESEENLGKYKVPVKLIGKNKLNKDLEFVGDNTTYRWYKTDKLNLKHDLWYTPTIESGTDEYIILGEQPWYTANCIPLVSNGSASSFKYDMKYKYIGFHKNGNPSSISDSQLVQIEEGTVATDYEEYFERTTNAYLNSPLLEGDEFVMKDGKLCHYHKYGKEVFDGSDDEPWQYSYVFDDKGTYRFRTNSNNYGNNIGALICDKIPTSSTQSGNEAINLTSSCNIEVVIAKSKINNSGDVNEFKQWLQANPITVVYELTEPYCESISSDKLLLECANNSTLHIESIVPVESVSASYTGGVPSVYGLQETNDNQDSLIDISLCATDEMYTMIEPLLSAVPQTLNNERMISKNSLGEFYLAMVQRNLKAVDEVPLSFREYVLEKLKNS